MSSFACEHCGAVCCDSFLGYTTGCEHYPPDANPGDEVITAAAWNWEQHQRFFAPSGGDKL